MKNIALGVLTLCIPLVFWGWAYEVSYFYILGLDVNKIFGLLHYIYSSFIYIAILFIVLITYTVIFKFFSKNVDRNDWAEVKETLSKTEFIKAISDARFVFLLSIGAWVVVFFSANIKSLNGPASLGHNFLLLIWLNILQFFASLYLSPKHSRGAIVFVFILSIGVCFSMGGIASARIANQIKESVVRDDALVVITRENGKYVAVAKPVKILLPYGLKKYLDFLI